MRVCNMGEYGYGDGYVKSFSAHSTVSHGLWVPGASSDSWGHRDRRCQHGRLGEAATTEIHCYCHPMCDIPCGCCSFTGPWTVTRSSLRMLRRVAAFCRPLRPVLLLVLFPRSRSPVVGVLGLC